MRSDVDGLAVRKLVEQMKLDCVSKITEVKCGQIDDSIIE